MGKLRLFLAVAMALPLVSCPVDHPNSIVILQAAALTRQNQCTIQAQAQAQYVRAFGVLDLAVTNHYFGYPVVMNNMPSSMDISGEGAENLEVETNTVTFYGAEVRLDIPIKIYQDPLSDQTLLYSVQTDGFFSPGAGGAEPGGVGITAVELIPPDVGNVLQNIFRSKVAKDSCLYPSAWVYAYFRIRGSTTSGHEVVSNEFMLPIRLCWGCLVRYVTDDPYHTQMTNTQPPCLPGQDEPMDNVLCTKVAMDPDVCIPRCLPKK